MEALKVMRSFVERTIRFVATIGMVFVLPLMLITTADVVGRGFFNKPIAGTFELSEYMLAVIILLGAAYTQQVKGHVAVDFLTSRFSTKTQALCQSISVVAQFVHCEYSGVAGIHVGDRRKRSDRSVDGFHGPHSRCLLVLEVACYGCNFCLTS